MLGPASVVLTVFVHPIHAASNVAIITTAKIINIVVLGKKINQVTATIPVRIILAIKTIVAYGETAETLVIVVRKNHTGTAHVREIVLTIFVAKMKIVRGLTNAVVQHGDVQQ